MKGGEKARLGVVRLMLAAVKQREVDERIELDDTQVLAVLDKMVKQRRDSIAQYTAAGRQDLADTEAAEIVVIQEFLPESLSEDEILAIIAAAIAESGAESVRDMGRGNGDRQTQGTGSRRCRRGQRPRQAEAGLNHRRSCVLG